jgi:hypothetical protein
MIMNFFRPLARARFVVPVLVLLWAWPGAAQTCATTADMDQSVRAALENAGQQFFQMAARGDSAAMQQSSIGVLAANFGPVAAAVNDNKDLLTGAQAGVRNVYLLDAPGSAPLARAEFFCGVWRTPQFVAFAIPDLPPGRYAVVFEDVKGGKAPGIMSLVLRQADGKGWKLAGFYLKAATVGGHDADWFLAQARQYKTKGELHNAWFYYQEARDLLAPVPFMSTAQLDQLYDEAQAVRPSDLPPGSPLSVMVSLQEPQSYNIDEPGKPTQQLTITKVKTFTITQMFAVPVQDGLDVVAKYQSPDISNTAQTWAENMAVAKALVAKYPEFREAFSAVVVRAVAPNGDDFGTELAMKSVK